MIAVVDYGVGNLFSVISGLKYVGADVTVTADTDTLEKADKLLLPGVGAFGDAADLLKKLGLYDALRSFVAAGKPLLGICLGMQLLFERSYEYGVHEGLSLIPGEIRPLSGKLSPELKIPQIGWNALSIIRDDPLLNGIHEGDCVYFVHSYYAENCAAYVSADAEYGVLVPALVRNGNVWGAQFHPEKSGAVGLRILENFVKGL